MGKNKNQRILIIMAILIIIVIIFAVMGKRNKNEETSVPEVQNKEEFVQVLDDGTKLNVSNKLKETKTLNGLEISNIQLTTNSQDVCVLLADVKNNTGKDTDLISISITLLDKEGKEIQTIPGLVSPMKNGESVQLNSAVSADFANAYDFKVKMN